ncbi:DUF4974 domain-containing protein [Mucilaginibacter conchicola]|uniref:DUF4974 domain-containing protein n=1 Tax=Mucilaginibacter conchicola TaxID=2303333 RepID=A0A372NP91_9SPHI|nr:FecR domain-containing protein [Mucilaginibacter conchicola]RFZ90460.1 DUF4974 domain-containing protein [Mucilaginibacter conchicola]
MNTDRPAELKALLEKYKLDQCTPAEKARVEQWLQNLSNNAPDTVLNEKTILKRARRNIMEQTGFVPKSRIERIMPFMRVAAVLLLVAGGAAYWYSSVQTQAPVITRFATRRGEQKTIMLPDSTEITLNSSSALTLSSDFNQRNRRVSLVGEGFFHVKHNPAKPFIVSTGELQTRVLGTQFDVFAYPEEKDYKIAVVDGRVRVSEAAAGKVTPLAGVLTRNLMITYNKASHKSFVGHTDADDRAAWKTGRLYFEKASVRAMARALSRKYNVDIEVNDKPGQDCRYTVGFNNQPLDDVLRVLQKLTGLSYQYNNQKVIINTPNCN